MRRWGNSPRFQVSGPRFEVNKHSWFSYQNGGMSVSETLLRVVSLVDKGDVRISDHGYDELSAKNIFVSDLLDGAKDALVVEDYPKYGKGPCVLVLQRDRSANPLHVVWGIPKGKEGPAVLVTAYRPDPTQWSQDFLRRRR